MILSIEYFKEIAIEANKNDSAGIGIKVGEYLDEIPEEIIKSLSLDIEKPV